MPPIWPMRRTTIWTFCSPGIAIIWPMPTRNGIFGSSIPEWISPLRKLLRALPQDCGRDGSGIWAEVQIRPAGRWLPGAGGSPIGRLEWRGWMKGFGMKDEYDFSKAEQGRGHRPIEEFDTPIYLDKEAREYFMPPQKNASSKKSVGCFRDGKISKRMI